MGHAGDGGEVGVGEGFAVGEGKAFEGLDFPEDGDGAGGIDAFAELEIFEGKVDEVAEGLGGGPIGTEFEAFEMLEFGEVDGGGVGEVGVGEAERLVIRETFAEVLETLVVDLAAAEAGAFEAGPAREVLEGLAGHRGADEGEAFELFEAGEVGETGVVQFGLINNVEADE